MNKEVLYNGNKAKVVTDKCIKDVDNVTNLESILYKENLLELLKKERRVLVYYLTKLNEEFLPKERQALAINFTLKYLEKLINQEQNNLNNLLLNSSNTSCEAKSVNIGNQELPEIISNELVISYNIGLNAKKYYRLYKKDKLEKKFEKLYKYKHFNYDDVKEYFDDDTIKLLLK